MIKKAILVLSITGLTALSANSFTMAEELNSKVNFGIGLYTNAPGATLDGYAYDNTHIINFKGGMTNQLGPIGWYVEMGITANTVKGENSTESVEPYLEYTQYGVGINYTITDEISMFAGIGTSKANGTYTDSWGNIYESRDEISESYTTVGATYLFSKYISADISLQSVGGVGIGIGLNF